MAALYSLHAPLCAYPGCLNRVSYHKKGNLAYNWKSFCRAHRKERKFEVDNWKLSQGCANIDLHHGFICTSHITAANQLDIHHIDGNKHNQNEDNIEILCKMCHTRVSHDSDHHLQRYNYISPMFGRLFTDD